jgi:hypothetical protein
VSLINNGVFAYWICGTDRNLVEVVRKGKNNTRIRSSLKGNGDTFLVKTASLENFHTVKTVVLN